MQTEAKPVKANKSLSSKTKRNLSAYLYISPSILIVLFVSLIPMIYALYISFTNMGLYTLDNYHFVGLKNYIEVFTGVDAQFIEVLLRTLLWTVVNVVAHVVIGVGLALLLNRKSLNNIYRKIIRSLLILPWAIPNLISMMVWYSMYNEQFGFINQVLKSIGMQPISWLTDTSGFWPFVAVCIANIWAGFPFMMMVASSGLQSIPEELYEAGEIDGASGFARLKYITLPLLKPTMVPSIILGVIWTFTNFNSVYLITGGGPMQKTDVLATYTFNALKGLNYRMAATYGAVTTIILIIITLINMRTTKVLEEEAM